MQPITGACLHFNESQGTITLACMKLDCVAMYEQFPQEPLRSQHQKTKHFKYFTAALNMAYLAASLAQRDLLITKQSPDTHSYRQISNDTSMQNTRRLTVHAGIVYAYKS